jgi:hypothetical protein
MTNGFVFWEGASPVDGAPLVAIVTGTAHGSDNSKTGAMCQAWILRSDLDPVAAVMSGKDRSICGDCQHRSGSNVGRSCYVIWWLAPLQIYKAFKAGKYDRLVDDPVLQEVRMHGHRLRIGAYGDPAMLPYRAWLPVVRGSSGAIGYTQQWRSCDPMFARLLMASVQSRGEKTHAAALGWRTFRTRPIVSQVLEDEVICPASNEAGHAVTCEDCQLCQGTTKQAKSVAIIAHGQRVTWFAERPDVVAGSQ